ncbi:MAG: DUF1624 domain-containing protein [Oscillospiraceae bacterium]|nr:DUF1624 domain-containing protein [Oscillospiraceae bacterium]
MQAAVEAPKRERISALDILRGGAMILVMLYHLLFDLRYIYNIELPRAITPMEPEAEIIHICFLWVLFAVSGVCTRYSKDPVKRGAFLYIVGFLITLVTSYFVPSELIVFGVLSCFGALMAICGLLRPLLDKIPWQPLLIASVLLWIMFKDFHHSSVIHLFITDIAIPAPAIGSYLYPIGITSKGFYSADYFPIIPYIFMFLTGYALHIPVNEHKLPEFFYRMKCPPLEFIGRHSLIFYAIHQPIMLLILEMIL